MHREGNLIFFDPIDRDRYSKLPEWLAIEAVPGVFEDIKKEQQKAAVDIQQLNDKSFAEGVVELQKAHVHAIRLQKVAHDLGELAGDVLIESMLPAEA